MASPIVRALGPALAVLALVWALSLPLRDVLAYPDRVSVLPNLQTDALAYHGIAEELARTWSLDALPPRHPPGWVTLLAAVYSVTGPSFVAGKVVSWLALVAAVALCAVLARRVYGAGAGWIAALLCATAPAMRGYVGTVQYEVVTAAMVLGLVLLVDRVSRASDAASLHRRVAAAGLAGGLLVLTRESFLLVVPALAIWIAGRIGTRFGRRPAALAAALLVTVAVVPAVLWSAVQSVRHGTLITISEKGPMVVAFGNNPLANGTYNAPLVGVGEPTGLAYVRQAPGRSLVLAGRKTLYFWGVLRDGWNVPRPAAVWAWRASTGLLPLDLLTAAARGGWLLALFLVSIWWLGRDGWRAWWILPASVLAVMAVHVVTVSSHRFAVPTLPIVFVLASGPLLAAVRWTGARLRAPAVAAATALFATLVVAMQFQAWPLTQTYRAAALEGIDADNRVDEVSGRMARFAAAARGVRPVALVTDEYLPAGSLRLELMLRRTAPASSASTPLARVVLVELNGRVACARDVAPADVAADAFTAITVDCRLTDDTPATLAVHSLGAADFAVDAVRLSWTGP